MHIALGGYFASSSEGKSEALRAAGTDLHNDCGITQLGSPSLNPNGIKIPADQAMVSIHFRLAKSCLYGQQFFVERIDTFHQRHS